jgi:hypothetical protein
MSLMARISARRSIGHLLHQVSSKNLRRVAVTGSLSLMLFTFGCLEGAAARIQQAIDELVQQSAQWQTTLERLERDLVQSGQSTIATEVTQLIQRGVGTGGTQIECTADFIGQRMAEDLTRLKEIIEHRPAAPRRQFFCGISSNAINLALAPERRNELDFFGYNLDAGRAEVLVIDNAGHARFVQSSLILATPTHYLMTLNLSEANGLKLQPTDQQIVFKLNPGLPTEESHKIDIIGAPTPRQFSVSTDTADIQGGGGFTQGPFRRICPSGTVATGIEGRSGEFIDQIELVCSPLNGEGSTGTPTSLVADGGPGGNPFSQTCPEKQVLVGFYGGSSGNVERIGGVCNHPEGVVGQTGFQPMRIGPNGGSGGSPFVSGCKPTFAVTGLIVWRNNLVSRVDFQCTRIEFN